MGRKVMVIRAEFRVLLRRLRRGKCEPEKVICPNSSVSRMIVQWIVIRIMLEMTEASLRTCELKFAVFSS